MNSNSQSGMTLLELVVALAVLGFVALILGNVMGTSASGTQAVIAKADQMETVRLVHRFLRRQVASSSIPMRRSSLKPCAFTSKPS